MILAALTQISLVHIWLYSRQILGDIPEINVFGNLLFQVLQESTLRYSLWSVVNHSLFTSMFKLLIFLISSSSFHKIKSTRESLKTHIILNLPFEEGVVRKHYPF